MSVAFDVGFDFDFDLDFLSSETWKVPHPCAFFAQGWELRTPAAHAFEVDVAFDLV